MAAARCAHGTFLVTRNCLSAGRCALAFAGSPAAQAHVGDLKTSSSPATFATGGSRAPAKTRIAVDVFVTGRGAAAAAAWIFRGGDVVAIDVADRRRQFGTKRPARRGRGLAAAFLELSQRPLDTPPSSPFPSQPALLGLSRSRRRRDRGLSGRAATNALQGGATTPPRLAATGHCGQLARRILLGAGAFFGSERSTSPRARALRRGAAVHRRGAAVLTTTEEEFSKSVAFGRAVARRPPRILPA